MNKTTNWIVGIIIIAVVIWFGFLNKADDQIPSEKETIKIGVSIPLSGDVAFLGEGVRDAMLLAKENLGYTKYNYEIIFEDDQFNSTNTLTAVNKLISIDKVSVISSLGSNLGNVVSPIAEENKIVHINIGASDSNVAEGYYNFIHWTQPSEEVRILVEELKKRGIKKVGIFVWNQQGMVAVIDEFKNKIKDTNIEIVAEQVHNEGEKDFRSSILKVKSSGAEIYLLATKSPEVEILTKQIKEAGISIPITAIESFELSDQIDLFEGNWFVSAASPLNSFNSEFNEKYERNPSFGAANAYDLINLIVMASESKKTSTKPTTEEIAEELLKIKSFFGALGELNVMEDGIIWSEASAKEIKNGVVVELE